MTRPIYLALPLLAVAIPAQEKNWPQFRGMHARGIAEGFATPTEWDVADGDNVAWKTPIPGLAHSSPVVWGDRIYVTTAVRKTGEAELSSLYGSPGYGAGESVLNEGEHEMQVYCLNKNSGEILWQRTAYEGIPEAKRHPKSTQANPTPAVDANRIVASFGSNGVFCYDHEGSLQWSWDPGFLNVGAPGNPDKNGYQWGYASSPVLHGERVFVQCDHEGQSFITALDASTGKELWRRDRDENSTWSTPAVHGEQLILNGYMHIGGYQIDTGEEVWKLSGGGDVPIPTPIIDGDLIFLTSAHGRERPIRAVHISAEGTLRNNPDDEEHLAWQLPRRGIYAQTPIVYQGLLYACSDGGILACYDPETGAEKYRQRLGAGRTGFSGSAVAADGKLYFSGENGEIMVVKAGPTFELLAVNDMGEVCMATPAISAGTLFFRTRTQLVAVRR